MRPFFLLLLAGVGSGSMAIGQLKEIPNAPSLRGGGEPVAMVPTFEPGKTYRFISENVIRMQLPGKGIKEAKVEQQTRFDATLRSDGRAGVSLKARIERLKVDFQSGEKRITYDSFDKEDRGSQLGQHFRNSLNRWVELKMSPQLEILEVNYGGREGLGTLLPGVPQFGLNEVEKLVAEIPQGLPDGKVRPGGFWQLNGVREIADLGDLSFEVTYRYRGNSTHETRPCYEIQVSGQLGGDTLIPGEGGALAGGEMSFQGTSLNGRILFDPMESTVLLKEQSVSMLLELPSQEEGILYQVPVEQQARIRLLHVVQTP
ncbi:MAG: hypothetical protein P1U58_08480 [Verrucomicrobiales bacterium]|nr:hypothetical protein [Verrucomicrobiales bacterium]